MPNQGRAVRILLHEENRTNAPSQDLIEETIEVDSLGLLMINATCKGRYQGPTRNAGVIISIFIDDVPVAQAQSFEGTSSSIWFFESASYSKLIQPNTPTKISVKAKDNGGPLQDKSIVTNWHVLKAAIED